MLTIVLTSILAFLVGVCIAAGILGARAASSRARLATLDAELTASRNTVDGVQARLNVCGNELRLNTEARGSAEREVARLSEQLKQQERQFQQQMAAERQQSNEKLELLASARIELSNQFKTLANDILEEKTKRFTEQNQSNLSQLLTPWQSRSKASSRRWRRCTCRRARIAPRSPSR